MNYSKFLFLRQPGCLQLTSKIEVHNKIKYNKNTNLSDSYVQLKDCHQPRFDSLMH